MDQERTIAPRSSLAGTGDEPTLAPHATTPSSDSFNTPTHRLFSKYEIIEEIARGGMGVIYKARDPQLNRIIALKMILGGRFSSLDEMQRFQVESEAAAKLDHPGIVPVFEAGEHDGQAFLAMKYIGSGSLANRIEEFRDERRAARLVSDMAEAVYHAHQRGILHRDLKPANVLIDENDQPLITDLGLAKNTFSESNLTNTGVVVGTPSYMPPEQASGESVTTSADIYSLGAMLYELLTGRPPHRGNSAIETVLQVLNEPITQVRDANSMIDRDLALICMHCLHHQPESRYASAKELAEDLDSWLAGDPISVKPATFAKRTAHWIRHNQGIFYVVMLMLLGTLLSLPLALSILGVIDEVGTIYANNESDPLPLIYSFANIPLWVSIVCGVLTFLIWPSLGMLVTLVSRPKNWLRAACNGALVAGLMALLLTLMLGWAAFAVASQASSSNALQILASNVWPREDDAQRQSAEERLVEMYPVLAEKEYNQKATYLRNRIVADGVAVGPNVAIGLFVAALLASLPTVIGAVIAHVLLKRRQRWWLFGPRYFLAWFSAFITVSVSFGTFGEGVVNGRPVRDFFLWQKLLWILVPMLVTFLVLRRWRKKTKEPKKATEPNEAT